MLLNMMLRKTNFYIALIGLFTYLALVVGHFQGLVFCIEKDGQVSLETGINGICIDVISENPLSKTVVSNRASLQALTDCNRCVDVPVTITATGVQGFTPLSLFSSLQVPVALGARSAPMEAYLANATVKQMPHPPPLRKPEHHTYLGTVILLI